MHIGTGVVESLSSDVVLEVVVFIEEETVSVGVAAGMAALPKSKITSTINNVYV